MYLSKSRYIQLIHVGKGQLGWDEELYRQVLKQLTKKDSCRAMNLAELKLVLDHMKSKGFKVIAKKRSGKNSPITRDKEDKTQLDKLRQLWIAMKYRGYIKEGSEQALLNWSKNQAKRLNKNVAIERLEWLQPKMLHTLIEQLKCWYIRLMAKDMAELAPDLKALPLYKEEQVAAQRYVYDYSGKFQRCNVEQLEAALNFTGQMLGKYSEVSNV
ncbi:gp16 family protein [Pseudoalteromonas sp. S16_S37]|uniref:gp16 family protein n=1 Tax=Pseudoalteromonas sp. S16_S37 TaxID=2720228 RepID=UPI001681A524|nr:regulatory protein GemA [Pseudoalteromonas sp. S16_S37]MBD1584862.1 regulatory protein GemA [Pseudoalteromonas sp. S16_S37]